MVTINISLPEKLKEQADSLIRSGLFVSFSDLVRHSLRDTVSKNKYDLLADETRRDIKKGKALVFKTKEDLKKYFDSI